MFFINTIKRLINNRSEARKARRLSIESMNNYFNTGERVHSALLAAEDIMGTAALGIGKDDVRLDDDKFELTIKYKVDDRLTTYVHRSYTPYAMKRLGRKSPMTCTLSFAIDGIFIKFIPETYQKLAEQTIVSIYKRVKEYGQKADENLANYMAEHFTDGVPNECEADK